MENLKPMSFSLHHPLEYAAKVGERCVYAGGWGEGPIPCKVVGIKDDPYWARQYGESKKLYHLKVTGHKSRIYPYGYEIRDVSISSIRRPKKTSGRRSR